MKTIIMIMAIVLVSGFVNAQNASEGKTKTLYIVKTDTKEFRTNHFLVDTKDVENMLLPTKDEVSKKFGPVSEDVVIYVTLKKNASLMTLPMLLAKYNISAQNQSVVLVDGVPISGPDDLLSSGNTVKNVSVSNGQINIITKTGPKVDYNRIKTVH